MLQNSKHPSRCTLNVCPELVARARAVFSVFRALNTNELEDMPILRRGKKTILLGVGISLKKYVKELPKLHRSSEKIKSLTSSSMVRSGL